MYEITLNVTSNVGRSWIIYILNSSGEPTRQFVTNGSTNSTISFEVIRTEAFTIQVYGTLYSVISIDEEKTLKKTYDSLSGNTTINISISGVANTYNWVMI